MRTIFVLLCVLALQSRAQTYYVVRGVQLTPDQFEAVYQANRLNYTADGRPTGNSAMRLSGRVTQIIATNAVLVSTGDELVAVRTSRSTDATNEGDAVDGLCARVGNFDYTTVLGAAKRVPLLAPVACISRSTLLSRLQSGQINIDLSIFAPQREAPKWKSFGVAPAGSR